MVQAYSSLLRKDSAIIPAFQLATCRGQRYTARVYSIYLHIPFCLHRCAYCDFNTYAGLGDLIPAYTQALCQEIQCHRSSEPLPVHTIYFGGGTPSLLPIASFTEIFAALCSTFNLQPLDDGRISAPWTNPAAEISLEANPGTLSLDYLHGLRALGFNRISLGMQSAHPGELRLLERQHSVDDVIRSVAWARQAGFENINLDLIYGLPGQVLSDWERSLATALSLKPQHLSLYALTVEDGTPLQTWVHRGFVEAPDPDLAADMYDLASECLAAAGLQQYEISNWACESEQPQISKSVNRQITNPEYACAHNMQYWRNLPYLGLGAGAHGYFGGQRIANVLHPASYITRLSHLQPASLHPSPAAETIRPISPADEMAETMIMGLRLTREGVSDAHFYQRFGKNLQDSYEPQIDRLIKRGLLEWNGDTLRLTVKGRLLGNQVFMEFL